MSAVRDRYASPSDDDQRRLTRLIAIFQIMRDINPTLPVSYAQAFLAVALSPGQGPAHYAKALGVVQPVASRTLLEIGKKARTGGPGLGLVDSQQDPVDLRTLHYYLTPKGRSLFEHIMQILDVKAT